MIRPLTAALAVAIATPALAQITAPVGRPTPTQSATEAAKGVGARQLHSPVAAVLSCEKYQLTEAIVTNTSPVPVPKGTLIKLETAYADPGRSGSREVFGAPYDLSQGAKMVAPGSFDSLFTTCTAVVVKAGD